MAADRARPREGVKGRGARGPFAMLWINAPASAVSG